jgi:L-alanine-DL-glutamate epimerase-like enolase superfamily enzyme
LRVVAVHIRAVRSPLTRPYTIAGGSWDSVDLVLVELRTDNGLTGHGQASPAEEVTGETAVTAARELDPAALDWLIGRAATPLPLFDELCTRVHGPAARAALDMALHDLSAQHAGQPLALQLGRVHSGLRTSVTIGVKPLAETLAEADEYHARGFGCLKVKTGVDVEQDLERLVRLRERFGPSLVLRVDANQGHDVPALRRFVAASARLDIELIEQPLPPILDEELLTFPVEVRRKFIADESVHGEADLERLAALGTRHGAPFGGINVKLMKCGGPTAALRLARSAERAGLRLMWGCMDESVLGIAAALHTALASRATAYLDLDGSLDLAEDPYEGGFELEGDRMETLPRPGLGIIGSAVW